MDRRDCLATALAVGAAALNEAAGADRNSAAQVADRTSTLRITGRWHVFWVWPSAHRSHLQSAHRSHSEWDRS
jgi:hypothetical protein